MGFDPVAFVRKHGVVLASAKGGVPSVAEAVAGEPIRGSWWAHAKGKAIFAALNAIGDDEDVKCFKLIDGKVTFVHRRLWPAIVVLADAGELKPAQVAEVRQEHTASGAHRNITTRYPRWVDGPTKRSAARMTIDDARAALGLEP